MSEEGPRCSFTKLTELDAEEPTLIEGFPGIGLVAAIAVDQITDQLQLKHHGNIVSEDFPPVTAFHAGRVRTPVRVYAGATPPVMTLQSDIPLPPPAYDAMSQCVHNQLARAFGRAIFLVGAPAQDEEEIGEVTGIATDATLEQDLRDAGIELAGGTGIIGGITGALVNDCYQNDVPAAALIVKAHPMMPDPGAARAVIEDALEPLVNFDIDTTALKERAEEIQLRKQQVAQQLQQIMQQEEGSTPSGQPQYGMYR